MHRSTPWSSARRRCRGQGSSSGFKYGRAVGAIEAAIALCGVPLTIVEPTAWKKFHHLHGKDKELSRQRALMLFPSAHALLARKADHGRAEAALIGLYGAQLNHHGDAVLWCRSRRWGGHGVVFGRRTWRNFGLVSAHCAWITGFDRVTIPAVSFLRVTVAVEKPL
jgi:hypothetical protein